MPFDLPPIAKAAERLLVEIEQAVQGFPRCHKYATGKDLREQAMQVTRLGIAPYVPKPRIVSAAELDRAKRLLERHGYRVEHPKANLEES